ncbi:MAG TPA: hypothetical protein DCQ06_14370, partial [Myxococcales bacterium]|nr:hypothetical protein [Myxococcales bacterium]
MKTRDRLLWGAVSFVLLSGCTTSQAVRHWHTAAKAEQQGKLGAALREYAEAYRLKSSLVGAELNRLRILAERPGQKDKVSKRIVELQQKHPDRAEVNLFAAAWALEHGKVQDAAKLMEVATATKRADKAYRSLRSPKRRCGPYEELRGRLLVELHRAQRAWEPMRKALRTWTQRCPNLEPILLRATAEMYLAQGDVRPARNMLGRMTAAGSRAPKHLSAEIAFVLGETERLE